MAIATRPPPHTGACTIMDFEEEVKTHTRRVEAGERVRYGQACPGCGAVREEFFRIHDCRRRKFRLVVEWYIQVALSWILRWRCLRCGKRFFHAAQVAHHRDRSPRRMAWISSKSGLIPWYAFREVMAECRPGWLPPTVARQGLRQGAVPASSDWTIWSVTSSTDLGLAGHRGRPPGDAPLLYSLTDLPDFFSRLLIKRRRLPGTPLYQEGRTCRRPAEKVA